MNFYTEVGARVEIYDHMACFACHLGGSGGIPPPENFCTSYAANHNAAVY